MTVPLDRASRPPRPFWIFFSAFVLFTLGASAFFFLYNVVLVDLNFTEAQIGRIAAALSLGTIVGTLPAGLLASRFGARRVLLVATPLVTLALACRAIFPGYHLQLAFGFATGLTLCVWGVCVAPSVAYLTDERSRPFAFSAIFASGIGMAGVGSFAAGRLPAMLQATTASLSPLQARQATLLFACAVATLAVIPLVFLRLGTVPTKMPRRTQLHPFLIRFLPVAALWSFVGGAFMPFATAYFARHFALPLERITTIFTLSQAVQCAAVLLAPFALRRFGPGVGIMLSQILAACGLAALAVTHTASNAVWIYWGYIAMTYMSEPWLYSLLMDRVPAEQRSTASALQSLTTALMLSAAAALAGSAITRFGYSVVFVALALCAIASALLFRRVARPDY